MSLHRNPELLRHVWLELTPQRLAATPLVLALLLVLGAQFGEGGGGLAATALALFVLITVLWGAKQAGDSLNDEFTQGTWDSQRLSGMGAWEMTLGKLLGGPIFAWYGGGLCLLVYALTAQRDWPSLRTLLVALGLALSLHALALLSALVGWRRMSHLAPGARSRGAAFLMLLLLLPQLGTLFSREALGEVQWYGAVFDSSDFVLLSIALAAAWSVYGLHRAMREELAFRDPPTAWIGFLLFLFAYVGGWFYGGGAELPDFLGGLSPPAAHLAACGLIALAATYLLLFSERKDWLRLRRLLALCREGQARRAWALTPKWLATAALTGLCALLFAAVCLASLPVMDGIGGACAAFAFLAFLLRDGALVLGLNFTRDQRRADAAAGLYLLILYAVIPGLLVALELHLLAPGFWAPLVQQQPPWLVMALVQAAAAVDFALRRWRRLPV